MFCKLRVFGLALVTVLAVNAVAGSAAQAGEFEVEGGKTVTVIGSAITGLITGQENTKHEFSTKAGVVKCTPATFDGELKGSGTSLTLGATYGNTNEKKGCTIAGIAGPVVHMNSCDYLLTAGNTILTSPSFIGVAAHVKCAVAGDAIAVTASATCTITIPPQSFAESMITAENSGGPVWSMDIKVYIDITGIKYVIDGAGCFNDATGPSTTTDGTYKGVLTLLASEIAWPHAAVALTVK